MTKPMGPRCNIDCKYCYYLEKEGLYPSEKKFRMSEDMLEHYVRALIETSRKAGMKEVAFAWQGGEPTLLGLPFFERAVELQRTHCPDGIQISNSIQTNGILLDDDWARFLARENFLVGLSVDGPKSVHDRYRVDRQGRPTFDKVMQGGEILRRHRVEFNILCTVHRGNAGKGKTVYRFLRELGSPHIQFIPIVERAGSHGGLAAAPQIDAAHANEITTWSVSPRAYGKFLCDIFDIWYRQDIGRVFVQFFETQIGLWSGGLASLCVFAETCGNALAMEHNGDLYACDHFVYPEYKLGNIGKAPMDELVWSERAKAFGAAKKETLTTQCQTCKFRFACNGGCPKHRLIASKDGEAGHNYFCESYTMFFHHAGGRLRSIARALGPV
ncbi:anaerobic sulfatase maturase [Pseudoruegeria sp. SHC-113]|uniref:anaerobic sulfatase maturase n=1 Tax=Pseudoruegeria sp. SHC-113 TaxID=2855439 RepID=UPI0021BA5CB2|nr:anaerobic sulfatase maturase [Pseudoruegeria sp. SHC-113]